MPLLSLLRRPRAVRRALPTRRWPPRRRRSRAAMPPTRRSTGCSVARSRSKSLPITGSALEKRRASARRFFSSAWFAVAASFTLCMPHPAAAAPQNFLFTNSEDLPAQGPLLSRTDIAGAQVVYTWKSLETAKDQYDFSQIERDLEFLSRLDRKLFIQIQDRFFEVKHRNLPAYLLTEPIYRGGLVAQADNPGENLPEGHGWVTEQWNPAVRARFQKLLSALARKFDGRVWGINLPESSADIDPKKDTTGFTCDGYFEATLENIGHARKVFEKSHVVQYANFWPCEWEDDHHYMSRTFEFAKQHGI